MIRPKLHSRGWGPWRQEFYSYSSKGGEPVNFDFGEWHNVWTRMFGHFIYTHWPDLWRWVVNLPPLHRRATKRLQKHFPNIR